MRRKYGWNGGVRGIIAAFSGGFVFSLADKKPATVMRNGALRDWKLPEPAPLGKFRASVEDWRNLANE